MEIVLFCVCVSEGNPQHDVQRTIAENRENESKKKSFIK